MNRNIVSSIRLLSMPQINFICIPQIGNGYSAIVPKKYIQSSSVLSQYCLCKEPDFLQINSSRCKYLFPNKQKSQHRTFWGWLNMVFNKVDESRIKDVGPDRACAEWLVRCGASVRWRNSDNWTTDYNTLQLLSRKQLIKEVDATDSAIMYIGFPHFRGCRFIERIVLHKAVYLSDEALAKLSLLKESLTTLQVSSCGDISIDGLRHLKKLSKLEYLCLYDIPSIKDKESLLRELQESLPQCKIEWN